MAFNYQTNRVINGECEYCGIPAVTCEHYKEGAVLPMDETEKLVRSASAPTFANIPVPPLTEEEKADSLEASLQAKKEYEAKNANTNLQDPTGILEDEVSEEGTYELGA